VTRRRFQATARVGGAALLLGGCAERRIVAGPDSPPGAGAWLAVWVAGALCAAVAGILLTLPAWQERRGARVTVTVLTIQTGAAAVVSALLAGVAIRSWQLVDRPPDAPPAAALLRLSRIDGDGSFYALMVLLVAVLGASAVTVSALAARFAASDDLLERRLACGILAAELGGATFLAVRLALGDRGWPPLAGTLALPVLAAALFACWPPRPATAPVTPPGLLTTSAS